MGHDLRSGFDRILHGNPIATGIAAVAVGAAVGLAAPASELENEYLGPARDTLIEKGREAGADTVSAVKEKVQRAITPEGAEQRS